MVTNEELFRKMMRFTKEVRGKRPHDGERSGEGGRCEMHRKMREMWEKQREAMEKGETPPMPPVPPMHGMPPMPAPPMPGMHPMPPMPPHCGRPFGPHGPGRHGRGMSRERLLIFVAEHPEGVWQRDIAWAAGINPSSASELIGRLEADGFLVREADENDRRAALLKLTEAGMARAEELRAEREDFLEGMFSKLTDEEKETLAALLDKLLN